MASRASCSRPALGPSRRAAKTSPASPRRCHAAAPGQRRAPTCQELFRELADRLTGHGQQRAAVAGVFGPSGDRQGRAVRAGLTLLLSSLGSAASAQGPLCDTQWLAAASEHDMAAQVRQGGDPNAACDQGADRPLHHALSAVWPSIDAVRALMAHGADVLIPNRFGKTPWELAEEIWVEALRKHDEARETGNRTPEHGQAIVRTEAVRRIMKSSALDAFGNPALGRPLTSLHPCNLAMHGRHVRRRFSVPPDLPLSQGGNLPVEFHIHDSVPGRYRPLVRAAAAEWNEAAGFRALAIHREIDHGDSTCRQVPDSKNVIYWSGRSDFDPSPVHLTAGEAPYRSLDASRGHSSILITEVDIVIYEAAVGLSPTRELFLRSLRRADVQVKARDAHADVVNLQKQWLEVLRGMSGESFREWVIQLMNDQGIRTWEHGGAGFDDWILAVMNERLGAGGPLGSFDDLRSWLADRHAVDLERLRDHIDRNPRVKHYLLHEFGHALGLGHNADPRSLMYSGMEITPVPAVPRFRPPARVDDAAVHGLACTYGPLMKADPGRDGAEADGLP